MIKAQASIYAGEISCDPATALTPDLALSLRQRLALFGAILSDLLGTQTIISLGLIPPPLLTNYPPCRPAEPWRTTPGAALIKTYVAELILCLDGAWRVRAEQTGAPENHAMAGLFEAPALAPFLPGLCRTLLGEPLRLPSIPTLWLADAPSRQLWASNPRKWLLHHGSGRLAATDGRSSLADRLAWQRRLENAPWSLTASHASCWSD